MYSLHWDSAGGLLTGLRGWYFLAAEQWRTGGGRVRKCWYPLCILVKNWVIANGGIGGNIFILDDLI